MPKDYVQEILAHWTNAPKFIDHNGVEFVCRVVGSDGGGMFADFSCFEAIGRDARELSKKTSIFRFSFYELFLIYFCEVGRIAKRKNRRFRRD